MKLRGSPFLVLFVLLLGVALAATVSLLGSTPPAFANDTSVGGMGGDLYPLESTDIRLEAETVQAVCYRRFAEYRVDFKFVNSGGPQTLMLGFPYLPVGPEGNGTIPISFRAWQNGMPLAVSIGEGGDGTDEQGYFLHQATFPTGETMITVSYLSNPTWVSSNRLEELMPPEMKVPGVTGLAGRHDYWLHTGATWAGTIGKAVVRYSLADDFDGWAVDVTAGQAGSVEGWPWTTRPETHVKPDGRTYLWEFRDLEPTKDHDIMLAFTAPFLSAETMPSLPPAFGAVVFPDDTAEGGMTGWEVADGSPLSAWALGEGKEARVQLRIEGDRNIREFRIVTGRNDTLTSFGEYSRPKTVRVTLSDGATKTFALADEPSVQRFPLEGTAEWARVEILDVYPGSAGGEVYISEVSFGTSPAPAFAPFAELIGFDTTSATEVPTSVSPPPSTASPDGTDPGSAGTAGADSGWPLWPVVAFAVAGAAFIALIVLLIVAATRR